MEQTLQALGGILLKAIPTVILLLILHFYFKAVLFGPIEKMLQQRRELTEGAKRVSKPKEPVQQSFRPGDRRAAKG